MKTARFVACALAVLTIGCNNNPTEPSTPTPSFPSSELFAGTLSAGESTFYSFALAEAANVRVLLVSLTGSSGALVPAAVGLGFGIPAGTGCPPTTSANAAPALASQISTSVAAGTYCVSIADIGNLTALTSFLIRMTQTPNSATAPTPAATTETFATTLAVAGSSSRAFTASQAGSVSVTLQSVGPPSSAIVGLGLGIPRADGTGCLLGMSLATGAGSAPQIVTNVDVGTYCVRAFDLGNLTNPVSFSVSIARP